jgi:hypothetical protein
MNDAANTSGAQRRANDRPFKTLTMTLLEKTTRSSQSGMVFTNLVGEESPNRKARAVLFAEHAARFDEVAAAYTQEKGQDPVAAKARITLKKRTFTGRDNAERTNWEFHVRDFSFG